jgi:hypothetical protein
MFFYGQKISKIDKQIIPVLIISADLSPIVSEELMELNKKLIIEIRTIRTKLLTFLVARICLSLSIEDLISAFVIL